MADSNTGDEETLAIMLFMVVVAGAIVLLWIAFHAQISQGIIYLRQGEMYIASHWVEDDYRLNLKATPEMGDLVKRHGRQLKDPRVFEAWREYLPNARGQTFKFKDFKHVTELALTPYKYVIVGIFALFALYTFLRGPTSWFKKKFTVDTLIGEQANNFPHITPFINFDPSKMDARAPGDPVPEDLPVFAEALGPEEWIAFNKIPLPDGKLDRDMAKKAFEKQLGNRWKGPRALKPYQQIILAAFCLKAARKRNEADALLGRLARCWSHKDGLQLSKDPNLKSFAVKILKNKKMAESVIKVMKQHAYETTALIRALDFARSEGGVLAPAQFLWLRGYDRNLWYALNNLGKNSYHTEALAAMAHYKSEKRTMRPIPVPKIDEAVNVLIEHLESDRARPIPELLYSKKKEGKKIAGIMKPLGSN